MYLHPPQTLKGDPPHPTICFHTTANHMCFFCDSILAYVSFLLQFLCFVTGSSCSIQQKTTLDNSPDAWISNCVWSNACSPIILGSGFCCKYQTGKPNMCLLAGIISLSPVHVSDISPMLALVSSLLLCIGPSVKPWDASWFFRRSNISPVCVHQK